MKFLPTANDAIVSEELFARVISGEIPSYVMNLTYQPSGVERTVSYYDIGGDILMTAFGEGDDYYAITEHGTVETAVKRFVDYERVYENGDDLHVEASENFENIYPLPITIEREDLKERIKRGIKDIEEGRTASEEDIDDALNLDNGLTMQDDVDCHEELYEALEGGED